jgi:ABC-2 type transport system ATP-binding protein
MDEAEHLADRIVVISGGVIAAEGTAADLADRVQLRTRVSWDPAQVPVDALPDELRAAGVLHGDRVSVETSDVTAVVYAITGWALERGVNLASLSVMRPNLEDTFLRLTGEPGETGTSGGTGA